MSREVSASARRTADALVEECGRTYAAEAGIRLRDTPQPLYQLLVLSHLLSARIRASVAVAAARALFEHGMRTPRRMADARWQQRVDALGEGGYRRYDERTSTQLGEGAELVLDVWKGDLRRLRAEADGDGSALRAGLQRVTGIGPAGADIFVREVQGLWPETGFHVGAKGLQGAGRVGLPASTARLAEVAGGRDPAVFAAALVRAALDQEIADRVREVARARK
ncbi:endonuclease [Streptomyces sp. NPDC087897]|uniref:endonuclease n=1 Tax=Streptomyces sp. NPDC087897 TaxID=3365817 RepID=UPI00380B52AC